MNSAIELTNVTKLYSNKKGIKDVNLRVPSGEIFGFLGPNGAGKTTAIRTIMDFIRPDSGKISLFGLDAQKDSVRLKQLIGYLPADRQLYDKWTGKEHITFYESLRGKKSTVNAAKRLGLDLSQKVSQLSTGNKQKLALTLALSGAPKILIMDEPTSGLDPLLQQEIYELLRAYKKHGGTVFLSSHNLPEVEKICDRVGVIKDGSIVANESMQSIRDMSIHIITVTTDKPIQLPKTVFSNIEVIHHATTHAILKVKGDLNPIINHIAKHKVRDLEVTHASLEDIFMEYYR